MDGTVEAYVTAAKMQASHGATLVYPTTLTSSNEVLFESFETYEKALEANTEGAAFGGMHLEGPYFNPKQAGAQDPRYLRNPQPEDYLEILSRSNHIARWSFSPELEGAPEFAAELSKRGIIASAGHTDATFEQCDEAYKSGSSLITHFYSCISTIVRKNAYRIAGVMEYGYYQDGMAVEIIADGHHLPPELIRMIVKIKGVDQVAAVTDSLYPAGTDLKEGCTDGVSFIVEGGVCRLPDRSAFAGSIATADRLLQVLHRDCGIALIQAVKMLTAVPARIMGLDVGEIAQGRPADLVLLDENLHARDVFVGGKKVS